MESNVKLKIHYLKYIIVLALFPAIYTGFYPGEITLVSSISYLIIFFILSGNGIINYQRKTFVFDKFDYSFVVKILLIYNLVTYCRGFFNIDSDQDVYALCGKLLYTSFVVPFFVYLAYPRYFIIVLKSILIYGTLLCLVCMLYPSSNGMLSFQHNMSFVNVLLLFIPYIRKKYIVILILSVALFVVFYDIDRRSIVINMLVSFFIMLFRSFYRFAVIKKTIIVLCFSLPTVFMCLGVIGYFNVFEYIQSSNDDVRLHEEGRNIYVDSRTSIYVDVLSELNTKDKILCGLGANGKTHTSLVDNIYVDYASIYKYGRPSTESGMLNYIQYGGFIGYVVYSFLFLCACYFSLFKSRNSFVVCLGVFMCFKYVYSFVEDAYVGASLLYFYLWLGICYCREMREMSDFEIEQLIKLVLGYESKRLYCSRNKALL